MSSSEVALEEERTWKKTVTIAAVITFYFVVSLTLVFANKSVLNTFDFPYPLFMTWIQLIVQMACIIIGSLLSSRFKNLSFLAPLEWSWSIAWRVAPLTFVYLGMIAFNNICLQYVEVTFYQVARSLTIVWTIFFTYLQGKSTQRKAIIACFVVFAGFVVGSVGEVNFDWKGLIAGVISSAFVAYYGISIKQTLPVVENSEWRLLIYNTPLAIAFFVPVLYFSGELLILRPDPQHPLDQTIWHGLIISGVLGYLINIALFMQVNYTSPLTNAISGTAKACVQTLLGWLLWRNPISLMNGLGIVTVIGGSAWYSQVKYEAMKEAERADRQRRKDVENPPAEKS